MLPFVFILHSLNAGFSDRYMWVGLRAKTTGDICDSPESCDGRLEHHLPGVTSDSADDIASDFLNQDWINTGFDVRNVHSSGYNKCLIMKKGGDDNYEITNYNCGAGVEYYCRIPCSGNWQKTFINLPSCGKIMFVLFKCGS